MTALFSPEWLERDTDRAPVRKAPPAWRPVRRRWRQTTLAFVQTPKVAQVPRAAMATRASRKAVRANPMMQARAEGRKLGLYARDNWAEVVIVVPPTRDAGERDARQVRNVPDVLGRVRFVSTGYDIKANPRGLDNMAELDAWKAHLDGLGRKWRMA